MIRRSAPPTYPPVARVTDLQRVRMVKEIFASIPRKYDFLNHVMSAGQDVHWRRVAARRMRFFDTFRYLDVAAGTGDLGIAAALRHPGVRVTAVDFVAEMLRPAQRKIRRRRLSHRCDLVRADALHLPFPDASFDAVGIAFGIRNIPDKARAFKEMTRAVVPGGQVLVLEMTLPQHPFIKGLYGPYLIRMLPALARAFSPNPDAYGYLAESILDFPSPRAVRRSMEHSGLVNVSAHPLTLGITHLFIGYRAASRDGGVQITNQTNNPRNP